MLVDRSGRVWAMRNDPHAIQEAMSLREARSDGRTMSIAGGSRLDGSEFARVVSRVAVVPVRGMLLRSMNWRFWSYEEIQRDVALAVDSDEVDAIVLDIDSPGGYSAGVSDLADWLRGEAREAGKPIHAFIGGMGASAAYNIAASCEVVGMGSSSSAGSIGTVIEYVDMEPFWEQEGARIIRVVAEQSPNKRLDPESAEGQAEMQALVDAGAAEFIASVAAGRGVSEARIMADFGQGLVFDRDDAIRRGMADTRTTLSKMIAELAGRDTQTNAAPAAAAQETHMNWESITSDQLREHRADLVADLEAKAKADAEKDAETKAKAAADAERARILAIDEVAMPGHEDLVSTAKSDGKTTAAELALQILKADKAAGSRALDTREADDGQVAVPSTPQAGSSTLSLPEGAPIEDRARAEWDKDAKIRAEFDTFETYLALRKAEDAGRARVLKKSA